MVDQARREQLLSLKLGALIREQWPGTSPQPAAFAFGSAATVDTTGWVLVEDRPASGLGPALVWAVRSGITDLHVLAEHGTGVMARRATAFRLPIEVWHVEQRTILPAIVEPLETPPPISPEHAAFRELIVAGGATPVDEHGVLVGEVRGLEVCRVVTDPHTGVTRLEVGIGQHDREAFQMMHGDVPPAAALAKVVAAVAPHREVGAQPHPLNRLGHERVLRARIIDDPALVDATSVKAAPSPVQRANLKDPLPSVAIATIDGSTVTLVISSGVDLDLVPFATDARYATGNTTRLVVPARDALPVQFELAALLHEPMEIMTVN
jgi:hypothetical protein